MKVSQLAKNLNVAPDTVRYYSRIGLIQPQINPENGYKDYNRTDQKRLHFILNARHLGFSVKDIQNILAESDTGRSSCPLVKKLIEKRLSETEKKFAEMQALRARMKAAVTLWQNKPNLSPSSEMICHLIEGFTDFDVLVDDPFNEENDNAAK